MAQLSLQRDGEQEQSFENQNGVTTKAYQIFFLKKKKHTHTHTQKHCLFKLIRGGMAFKNHFRLGVGYGYGLYFFLSKKKGKKIKR